MTNKPNLSIGLIGSGFMGKAHVFGFATAQKVFNIPAKLNLHTLADVNKQAAKAAADEFGFTNSTDNWRELVQNPEIDIIDITCNLSYRNSSSQCFQYFSIIRFIHHQIYFITCEIIK